MPENKLVHLYSLNYYQRTYFAFMKIERINTNETNTIFWPPCLSLSIILNFHLIISLIINLLLTAENYTHYACTDEHIGLYLHKIQEAQFFFIPKLLLFNQHLQEK